MHDKKMAWLVLQPPLAST